MTRGQTGEYAISFVLKPDATDIFGEYTTTHTGQYLAIVLDKQVISAPVIKNPITDGQGQISGSFTQEYRTNTCSTASLGRFTHPDQSCGKPHRWRDPGEESVRKSVQAGIIGLIVVILFMGIQLPRARHHR